jgi:glucosamine--fructose-6-phosphate aminotransferase (isomerizing)
MERCRRCIMPDTVPGIDIDESGLCSYCRDYAKAEYLGQDELERVLSESSDRNSRYNCIVPVSGGRDSTYILYLARAEYGLRTLAVHYDNEFVTEQALNNMRRACDRLECDLVVIRSKRNIVRRIAKENILAASEFGQFRECAACTYGYRSAVYRQAKDMRIPLILWGESKEEATASMETAAFEAIRDHKLKYLKLVNSHFYRAESLRFLQRVELFISWRNLLRRSFEPVLRDKDIKEIRVFDYLPWDRTKIKKTIAEGLGWEKAPDQPSTWKNDCHLVAFTNFYYIKLFGCTKLCFGYCRMINSGQMTREEALRQEEEALANHQETIRELLETKIGLSPQQADKIILYAARRFSDSSL